MTKCSYYVINTCVTLGEAQPSQFRKQGRPGQALVFPPLICAAAIQYVTQEERIRYSGCVQEAYREAGSGGEQIPEVRQLLPCPQGVQV